MAVNCRRMCVWDGAACWDQGITAFRGIRPAFLGSVAQTVNLLSFVVLSSIEEKSIKFGWTGVGGRGDGEVEEKEWDLEWQRELSKNPTGFQTLCSCQSF